MDLDGVDPSRCEERSQDAVDETMPCERCHTRKRRITNIDAEVHAIRTVHLDARLGKALTQAALDGRTGVGVHELTSHAKGLPVPAGRWYAQDNTHTPAEWL